jgi:hypothetical protein
VVPVFPHLVQASAAEPVTHYFQIAYGFLQLDAEFLTKILGLLVDHCHDAQMALISCFHLSCSALMSLHSSSRQFVLAGTCVLF